MDDCSCEKIVALLESKSMLKQRVYDNALNIFEEIKETLHEINGEINDTLRSTRKIKVEYRDRGKFEAQIQVSSDMLIFSMHTNVFQFHKNHPIHAVEYVSSNKSNSYCAVINVFNFLADSFKYNRQSDEGYLIARIFINHENSFFIEGLNDKYSVENFGECNLSSAKISEIIFEAIEHAMEFDLLVPPFDEVKIVEAEQMNSKIENSRIKTGKRLGYSFTINSEL